MSYQVIGSCYIGGSWTSNQTAAYNLPSKEAAVQVIIAAIRSGVWVNLEIKYRGN